MRYDKEHITLYIRLIVRATTMISIPQLLYVQSKQFKETYEAFVSDFLEDLEYMFSRYYMYSDDYIMLKSLTTPYYVIRV